MRTLNCIFYVFLLTFFNETFCQSHSYIRIEYEQKTHFENISKSIPENTPNRSLIIKELSTPKKYYLDSDGEKSIFYLTDNEGKTDTLNKFYKNGNRSIKHTSINEIKGLRAPIIFKDFSIGKITIQTKIGNDIYITESSMHTPAWEILTDTIHISGFVSQKAILKRGEQTTIVWFTSEIPLIDGPFSYRGIPGVILKVELPTETIYATKISYPQLLDIVRPEGKLVTFAQLNELQADFVKGILPTTEKEEDSKTNTFSRKVIRVN